MKTEIQRVHLRTIKEKDRDAFYHFHNSSFVLKYNCMQPMNEEEVTSYIQKHQNDEQVLVIANASDDLMGMVFVHSDSLRYGVHSVEIAYWLGKPYTGQGFMTEALSMLIDDLFVNQQVRSITARVFQKNIQSQNLLKRLGFVHEGTIKQAVLGYGNIIYDDCLFSLFSKNWNK